MNNYGGAHVAPSIHLDGAYIEVTPGTWKRWDPSTMWMPALRPC